VYHFFGPVARAAVQALGPVDVLASSEISALTGPAIPARTDTDLDQAGIFRMT
jgi:hypothetical protein